MPREIPFARLGINKELRNNLQPEAPKPVRLAAARGLIPTTADVQLSICYILAGDPDPEIASAAADSIVNLPVDRVVSAIHLRTHPKVLEFLVETRHEVALDDRIAMHKMANNRTVRKIARRAGPPLCEKLAHNHERLLMTPSLYVDLHANKNCTDRDLSRAEGFLRMEQILPGVPAERPFNRTDGPVSPQDPKAQGAKPLTPKPVGGQPMSAEMNLEAEILAAIAGEQSPTMLAAQESRLEMFDVEVDEDDKAELGGFEFSFSDDSDELSWLLTEDRDPDSRLTHEEKRSIENMIRDMSPGQKIKLAYLGNQEARGLLLRDSNKLVSSAVVKSGRMTDGEALSAAGNKNLADDVVRLIANNREWIRKYPFQVALVNNPKCPVSTAMSMIRSLNRRDLQSVARNRNISGAVTQAATRLFKQKYQR